MARAGGVRVAGALGKPLRNIGYTLSEAARVTITIERRLRRPGGRYRRVGRLATQKQAGRRSTRFTGSLSGRPLRPGRYRAGIVAVDSLGARSSERRLRFRVVRP